MSSTPKRSRYSLMNRIISVRGGRAPSRKDARSPEDLVRLPQLRDLLLQPLDLRRRIRRQPGLHARVDLEAALPEAQCLRAHPEQPGDVTDRARLVLRSSVHKRNCPALELEDRYVVQNKDRGGWDVKKENAERSSGHFNTQKEAIDRAREIVDNSGGGRGDIRIQGRDGKFRDSDSGRKNESPRKDTR